MSQGRTPDADRLDRRFADLKAAGRAALIPFVMAGDPNRETSLAILRGLPAAGADVIELGMPYPYPSKDGPVISAAAQRARDAGATMDATLDLVRAFRSGDGDTPLVLMGYFGSVSAHGVETFAHRAADSGADAVLLADFPPQLIPTLGARLSGAGLQIIRIAAPDATDRDLTLALSGAGGFVYYASTTENTGGAAGSEASIKRGVARLRGFTDLPIAVGFGIKTPAQAAKIANLCDAVVVGSALVNHIEDSLDKAPPDGQTPASGGVVTDALDFVRSLSGALRKRSVTDTAST